MSQTLRFALNRMVAPSLSLERFVELALSLRIDAVELRNDLPGAGIEHGRAAAEVRALCATNGIRVLSINALYPFDRWNAERRAQALAAIREVGGLDVFRLLHDTFHHHLAGENELFPGLTGLVHISGVEDGALPLARIRDGHRVLVGSADLLGNARQLRELRAGGYRGYLSFEPFAGSVHLLPDIAAALGASIDHLQQALRG
ncbi:TIM barrel protein [Pseudomonas aeruginosa]|uniref:TIM barrel protein n=1 Tax=Pseudomonas aeruginosa TaxID=287 RepID=UPI002E2CB927|nr:TIM barrel protein [Pseudomonas aeruginosa]